MGFFNKAREAVFGLGKKLYNIASNVAPYVHAGIKTLTNHPAFITQLGGLATGALGLGGQLATGNIPGAVTTGAALVGMGKKTFGDISKAFKGELAEAKKGRSKAKQAMKMGADEIARLKEGVAALGKNKRVHSDVNVNE